MQRLPFLRWILALVTLVSLTYFMEFGTSHQIYNRSQFLQPIQLRSNPLPSIRSAEKSTLSLGCYTLSQDQVTYIQVNNQTEYLPSSKDCVNHCTDKHFVYSYFKPHLNACVCDNLFFTAGLGPPECNDTEGHSVHAYMSGQSAKVKYGSLGSRWRRSHCKCVDPGCTSLQCQIYKWDRVCWVGPMQDRLRSLNQTHCKGIQLVSYSYNTPERSYCVSDMYGFFPAQTCAPWLKKNVDQFIYQLKSANITVDVPLEVEKTRPQSKVLLITYYRSGSTFFSEFFKGYPNSHYVYEPLHGITSSLEYVTHEGTPRIEYVNNSIDVLDRVFNCQLDALPISSLAFSASALGSISNGYKLCFKSAIRSACVQALYASCFYGDMIVVKTIRAKMNWALNLLQNNHPTLKVVQLIRDPRGLYHSRMKTPKKKEKYIAGLHQRVKVYCDTVIEDYQAAQELMQAGYKGQILVVRYEDLVVNRNQSVEDIYRSLSLGKVPTQLQYHLNNLNSDANRSSRKSPFYSTARSNSLAAAFGWKESMNYTHVKAIDEICGDVYNLAGYLPVEDEEQLNNSSNYHITKPSWVS